MCICVQTALDSIQDTVKSSTSTWNSFGVSSILSTVHPAKCWENMRGFWPLGSWCHMGFCLKRALVPWRKAGQSRTFWSTWNLGMERKMLPTSLRKDLRHATEVWKWWICHIVNTHCVIIQYYLSIPDRFSVTILLRHWKDFISMSPRDIMRIPAVPLAALGLGDLFPCFSFKDITAEQRRKLDKYITLFNHGPSLSSRVGTVHSGRWPWQFPRSVATSICRYLQRKIQRIFGVWSQSWGAVKSDEPLLWYLWSREATSFLDRLRHLKENHGLLKMTSGFLNWSSNALGTQILEPVKV